MPNRLGKVARVVGADGRGRVRRNALGKGLRSLPDSDVAPPCVCCCADVYCSSCHWEEGWVGLAYDAIRGQVANAHSTLKVTGVGITEPLVCGPCHEAYLLEPYWATGPKRLRAAAISGCLWVRYDVLLVGYRGLNSCADPEVIWPVFIKSVVRIGGTPRDGTTISFGAGAQSGVGFAGGLWSLFSVGQFWLGTPDYLIPQGACSDVRATWRIDEYGDPCATSTYEESWKSLAHDGYVNIQPCWPCPAKCPDDMVLPGTVAVSLLADRGFNIGPVADMYDFKVDQRATIGGGSMLLTLVAGTCRYEGTFDWVDFENVTWAGVAVLEYRFDGGVYTEEAYFGTPRWQLELYKYPTGYTSYDSHQSSVMYIRECDPSPLGGMYNPSNTPSLRDSAWVT